MIIAVIYDIVAVTCARRDAAWGRAVDFNSACRRAFSTTAENVRFNRIRVYAVICARTQFK